MRGVATGWNGVEMSTLRLLKVVPEIDSNPLSFLRGGGRFKKYGGAPLQNSIYSFALRHLPSMSTPLFDKAPALPFIIKILRS